MKSIKKPFEYFEVTADIGFKSFGKSLEDSFQNAGLAMFNVITNTDNIKKSKKFQFTIESEDKIALLYDYLEELLFLHEIEFVLLADFKVNISKTNDNYQLKCVAFGDEINWDIHERKSEIKAITFHMMDVIQNKDYFEVTTILDL